MGILISTIFSYCEYEEKYEGDDIIIPRRYRVRDRVELDVISNGGLYDFLYNM